MDDLQKKRHLAGMLRRKKMLRMQDCFNPRDLDSRPTEMQQVALDAINTHSERYVLGGNQSGKSNLGGKECAMILTNTHSNWIKKPKHPLLLLVVGKTHKILKEELWESKIKPFLIEGTYKIGRDGQTMTSITHDNGNRLLFFSHKSPEECREAVQSFVADWVWLDEMPSSYRLLTELHTRCQATSAPFLATFTPLLLNAEIKNHVDNGDRRLVKKIFLRTYDNPVYTEEQLRDMKDKHALMSEAERETRTEGAWFAGENAVYDFVDTRHCESPEGYHPMWRHLEAVDPAASGKAGYALLAEDPDTGIWYVMKDEYIDGKAGSELVDIVKKLTGTVNCVKRVSDTMTWFTKEAAIKNITYNIPYNKNNRKEELIKGLQEAITQGKLKVAPWCKLTIDEFISCQWSESGNRIINAQHYHLLDCLQYAVDAFPSVSKIPVDQTIYQMMRDKHRARKAIEAQKMQRKNTISYARIMPKRRR